MWRIQNIDDVIILFKGNVATCFYHPIFGMGEFKRKLKEINERNEIILE